jgi:hypothetical protein
MKTIFAMSVLLVGSVLSAPIWVNVKPPTNKVAYTSDIYYFEASTNIEHKVIVKCTPNWYFPITNSIPVTTDTKVWVNFERQTLTISNKTEVVVIKAELEDVKFNAITNNPIKYDSQALSNLMNKTPFPTEQELKKYIDENLNDAFKSNGVDSNTKKILR